MDSSARALNGLDQPLGHGRSFQEDRRIAQGAWRMEQSAERITDN
jgi:hypothetical protein